MKTRILSGLIMLPLVAVLYFGGYILLITCFIISVTGVYEFYRGFKKIDVKPSFTIGVLSTLGLYSINIFKGDESWYMAWLFATVFASILYLFKIDDRKLDDAMVTITGIVYIVFFSYHVLLVDQSGDTNILIWTIILSAFGTDIFAYFIGIAIGKHKLCPKISPKKSVEGAIGGIIGSALLCGIFGFLVAEEYFIHAIVIGILGGIIAQFGDLSASIFKRKMNIKDYGNLIPGHGGILDRFDSLLFTAPMVYYYINLVI